MLVKRNAKRDTKGRLRPANPLSHLRVHQLSHVWENTKENEKHTKGHTKEQAKCTVKGKKEASPNFT